jgi:hypothetical protein
MKFSCVSAQQQTPSFAIWPRENPCIAAQSTENQIDVQPTDATNKNSRDKISHNNKQKASTISDRRQLCWEIDAAQIANTFVNFSDHDGRCLA